MGARAARRRRDARRVPSPVAGSTRTTAPRRCRSSSASARRYVTVDAPRIGHGEEPHPDGAGGDAPARRTSAFTGATSARGTSAAAPRQSASTISTPTTSSREWIGTLKELAGAGRAGVRASSTTTRRRRIRRTRSAASRRRPTNARQLRRAARPQRSPGDRRDGDVESAHERALGHPRRRRAHRALRAGDRRERPLGSTSGASPGARRRRGRSTSYDAVLVFGGAMHADQDDAHPWLARRRHAGSQRLLDRDTPVLGDLPRCAAARTAAGAWVGPLPEPEIGWVDVELTDAGVDDPVLGALPRTFSALAVAPLHLRRARGRGRARAQRSRARRRSGSARRAGACSSIPR